MATEVPPLTHGDLLSVGGGGVFNIGNLPFLGSLGGTRLTSPIVAITAT
ncbi:MAG: hypothetical protein GY708_23855 [Actinomycetia bacterium]|nr:hypothetical protein [Actinomycetes bacterium]